MEKFSLSVHFCNLSMEFIAKSNSSDFGYPYTNCLNSSNSCSGCVGCVKS